MDRMLLLLSLIGMAMEVSTCVKEKTKSVLCATTNMHS